MALQRSWGRLRPDDVHDHIEAWWTRLRRSGRASLNGHQCAVIDAYVAAKRSRDVAEQALRPWVLRHNKGTYWVDTTIERRSRLDGAAMDGDNAEAGLKIPSRQLLPFFLAARSVVTPGKDLLGEALCSSYEAFRFTRRTTRAEKDEQDEAPSADAHLSHAHWYLDEFDQALKRCSGANHPKVDATVRKTVDLWEQGEKVLVFAFYRHTCRALRIHISAELERRLMLAAQRQLRVRGQELDAEAVNRLLDLVQRRYFDDGRLPGRRALDNALEAIIHSHDYALRRVGVSPDERETLKGVMRRFLRVRTTLVRCFPLAEFETVAPTDAVRGVLGHPDSSGVSWQQKFARFLEFLTGGCSRVERKHYLEAAQRTQTRGIRVDADETAGGDGDASAVTLANVQVATGETRRATRSRLMRAFNTPFFPDVLVCSEVMGEGVDLQRFCRHVIHHDLAWNPSTIEQRTGRVDRIGCKAEGRQSIVVYMPYLAGTADERQYRVMTDRERWFRVVMGQEAVARLIAPDSLGIAPLPTAVSNELNFELAL
ncbi:MAG: SWF/SNF helicase family protein [Acidobacteria bacterium]|nr:SWF/SNF helicase family protein [Acidobacteriota bacterium]